MTLANMVDRFYKGKNLIVVKTVHDRKTTHETFETVEADRSNASDVFTYDELYNSEVVMFEAVKKNTLKVWTYREIN